MTSMNTSSASNRHHALVAALLVVVVLLSCVGCQTFNLSEDDFRTQQRGQMVDGETGDAVATAGLFASWGAMIAALVDWAVRK